MKMRTIARDIKPHIILWLVIGLIVAGLGVASAIDCQDAKFNEQAS